ncbi:MAG: thioredoxin domain-containing protein [Myxococcota bacterium]
MRSRPALILVFLGFVGLGATCKGKNDPDIAHIPASPPPVPQASQKPLAVSEIPGLDLARMRPESRAELMRLLNENFCYCGCPRTIAACLLSRSDCPCVKCSERMTGYLMQLFEQNMQIQEIEQILLEGFAEGYNGREQHFDLKDRPSKGAENPKYTLVEFADFHCSHCRAAFEPLAELVKKHPEVRLVYFYFPLGSAIDAPGVLAAEAAEEARLQGKFWELAKVMFDNQYNLEMDDLLKYGRQVGMDEAKLKSALEKHTHQARVLESKKIGLGVNVESTPTIYVNGRPFGLPRTLEALELRLAMEEERGRCE